MNSVKPELNKTLESFRFEFTANSIELSIGLNFNSGTDVLHCCIAIENLERNSFLHVALGRYQVNISHTPSF